ncbi:hypothetical protein D6825_01755 [Candidatus Woesearchaeota archaeon]|nr:MAG: hypothetical protein D6825_01755 [Candidatus Woesearchaeota archaeon]
MTNINDAISKLLNKLGLSKLKIELALENLKKEEHESVYDAWKAYRRFEKDSGPDPTFFLPFEITHSKRSYLHRLFLKGPEEIIKASKIRAYDLRKSASGEDDNPILYRAHVD